LDGKDLEKVKEEIRFAIGNIKTNGYMDIIMNVSHGGEK